MQLFADPHIMRVYHENSVAFIERQARSLRVKHSVKQDLNHPGQPFDVTLDCDELTFLNIKHTFNTRRK